MNSVASSDRELAVVELQADAADDFAEAGISAGLPQGFEVLGEAVAGAEGILQHAVFVDEQLGRVAGGSPGELGAMVDVGDAAGAIEIPVGAAVAFLAGVIAFVVDVDFVELAVLVADVVADARVDCRHEGRLGIAAGDSFLFYGIDPGRLIGFPDQVVEPGVHVVHGRRSRRLRSCRPS